MERKLILHIVGGICHIFSQARMSKKVSQLEETAGRCGDMRAYIVQ